MATPQFFWRRLRSASALLTVTVPAYFLAALFLAWTFQDALPPGTAAVWAAVTAVLCAGWLTASRVGSVPPAPAVRNLLAALCLGLPGVLALTYSWFFVLAFGASPAAGKLVLAAFTAALATLGAFSLAMLPLAAGLWVAGLGAGVLASLVLGGGWAAPGVWLLLGGWAAVTALVLARFHGSFLVRLRAEAQVSHQSQLVGLLLHDFDEGSQDWTWETDPRGLLRSVNPRLAQQLDKAPETLEGRALVDCLIENKAELTIEEEEELAALGARLAGTQAFHDLEVPVQVRGSHRQWKLAGLPEVDEGGAVTGWRGVGTDITEVRRLNNLNARLALLDHLTGLANRHRFQAVLHDNLTPRGDGRPCGLVLIDVQNFRMVNEGLGHEVGDGLLREIALRLRSRVPASALLARLGGDEFAVVAPGAGEEALEGLVAGLDSACGEPFQVAGHRLEVAFHMGTAGSPRDAVGAADLLKCAELALHAAKTRKLGPVVAFQPLFSDQARDRIRLHGELKTALADQQFELHYQPQIRLADGLLTGCEALVRWRHPVRGMVSPAEFIPALEETGLIIPAGVWILEAACREALTWADGAKVAVNVSAVQFASRTFLESVTAILGSTGLPARRLELEITESVMAQDPAHVVQVLRSLRERGVSISLDDFGTGYSSLSYLRTLPLDKLKVDQSFVRTMGTDPQSAAIVRTVLELSRLLGLQTTAEGVETEEQKSKLAEMGCDAIQGYLVAKPLRAEALAAFRNTG